jgi:hypothetical protein
MTDSNRELILEDFKTIMGKITEENGFDNDVNTVERKMLTLDNPNISYPALMVLGGREEYEDTLGGQVHSVLTIMIRGYSKDEEDPEGALNSLIRDVLAILENATYNATYHKSYRPIRLDTDEGWLNTEQNGVGMFELELQVRYRFTRGTP